MDVNIKGCGIYLRCTKLPGCCCLMSVKESYVGYIHAVQIIFVIVHVGEWSEQSAV